MKPSDVKYIVVHCAATPPTMDIGIKTIDGWHKERGFRCVGYHFFIKRDGKLQEGRKLHETGAHVRGYNRQSIGICLAGGVDKNLDPENNFTANQKATLKWIVGHLKDHGYKKARVLGHRELDPKKACPSAEIDELIMS